jgi:hypothetical protein
MNSKPAMIPPPQDKVPELIVQTSKLRDLCNSIENNLIDLNARVGYIDSKTTSFEISPHQEGNGLTHELSVINNRMDAYVNFLNELNLRLKEQLG